MTEKTVRTRFAPSPTGPLHIGGVRSALFGWLFARHHNGKFILRIEDTDQKRFVEGSVELITGALKWLGLNYDEGPDVGGPYGPYVQSERLEHYHKWIKWLLDNDKAYKCFATAEELKQMNEEKRKRGEPPGYNRMYRDVPAERIAELEAEGKPYVVRFKMPLDGKTIAKDMIRGDVEFENEKLQDIVLLKSDGFPTYHLAHVVDDYLMEITHVTRANEWLPSLPVHWQLWEAFGWEQPKYAHLPVLLNPNGKGKLSKRHAGFEQDGKKVLVLAKEFQDAGYLPEAMVNFLTNIGWNFGGDEEKFDVEDAIERFDLSDVNPSNSAFPIEKLDWLNGTYIRELEAEDLANRLLPVMEKAGLDTDYDKLLKVVPISQTRIKTLNEFVDLAGFFFRDYSEFQAPEIDDLIQRKMDAEGTVKILEASIEAIEAADDFSHDVLYADFKKLAKELGVKNGQLFGTLRVALTAQTISTPTFETMEILGKDETLRRVKIALDTLRQKQV